MTIGLLEWPEYNYIYWLVLRYKRTHASVSNSAGGSDFNNWSKPPCEHNLDDKWNHCKGCEQVHCKSRQANLNVLRVPERSYWYWLVPFFCIRAINSNVCTCLEWPKGACLRDDVNCCSNVVISLCASLKKTMTILIDSYTLWYPSIIFIYKVSYMFGL